MWLIRLVFVVVVVLVTIKSRTDAKKLYASSKDYEHLMKTSISALVRKIQMYFPSSIFGLEVDDAGDVFVDENGKESGNNTCFRDLRLLRDALNNQTFWAMKMVDASSKVPSGLLEFNVIDLGQYDECVNARGTWEDVEIHGRPCIYTASIKEISTAVIPLNPMLTICVPATCESDDLILMFNRTIDRMNKQIKQQNETIWNILLNGDVKLTNVSCSNVDNKVWDIWFIVCLAIFLIFVSFLLVCTVCDLRLRQLTIVDDERTVNQDHGTLVTLSKFSLLKNAAAILSTRVKRESLPTIHGIRFISMAWIVLGHQYFMILIRVNVNTLSVLDWADSWSSLYIFISTFAVDTFFTISGFLMAYLVLKQMTKQKHFNVPVYYLHRYFRLTPTVVVLIIFTIVFMPKIGTGPRWNFISSLFVDKCNTNWWSTILYIQNFVDPRNMCLVHTWYLAVDMQLFWISPIILYPLSKMPKIGLAILALLFMASIAIPAAIIGYNQYPTVSFRRHPDLELVANAFELTYIKPYCRASPWLIGIYFGYEVVTKNRKLTKGVLYAGWALCFASFVFCVFGMRYFLEPDYQYQPVLETLYTVVSRALWGFTVCWVIFACINNRNGPVTKLLNWKYLLPLSRLCYCIYLVHFMLQATEAGSSKVPSYFSNYYLWKSYLANSILCYIIAFFFSLLIEMPMLVLEKIVLRRESHSETQKDATLNGLQGCTQEVYRPTE